MIGTTDFWNILVSHQKLTDNVFLIKTLLGSCLAGINFPGKPIKEKVLHRAENNYITTDQLDSLVRRYWEFEKLPGDSHTELSADDFFALQHMQNNTTYDEKEKKIHSKTHF